MALTSISTLYWLRAEASPKLANYLDRHQLDYFWTVIG